MRKLFFILFSAFITSGLFSCKTGPGSNDFVPGNPQSLILGRWNLQQEKLTQYVNGTKQVDTLIAASNSLKAYAQFNQNGSYHSVSVSLVSSTNLAGPVSTRDSLAGTYAISNISFSVSAPYLAGFIFQTSSFGTITEVPVVTLVSHEVQLTQLNATGLTVHTEFVFNYTYPSSGLMVNYKTVSDLYYGK